jgi:hypothetical protein
MPEFIQYFLIGNTNLLAEKERSISWKKLNISTKKATNPISKAQKLTSDFLSNKFRNLFVFGDFQRSTHAQIKITENYYFKVAAT